MIAKGKSASECYTYTMILKIVGIKDPVLRKKAKRVGKVDKKIKSLIYDMQETLKAQKDPEGIGLAAPQVGKSLALFIVNFEGLKRVIINPEVIKSKKVDKTKKAKMTKLLEGCLSLPNYYSPVKRGKYIIIKYLDIAGKTVTEEFNDFPAQVIQHEIDHLDGVLFVDHVLKQNSPLYKFDGDEWEEVEL